MKSKTRVMTYPEFAKIKPQIALDNSFNVGSTENGRWKKPQMVYYMESVLYGMAVQNIVIVDIEKCLDNSVEGSADYDYFKKWGDAGFKYIAVDGNNRSITIHKFYEQDDVYLNARKRYQVETPDGRIADFTLNPDNNVFSKLPDPLKNAFSDAEVTIKVVERATRQEITDLFLRVNSGIHLNGQEKRNAVLSAVSEAVRKIGYDYDSSVGLQVMNEAGITRFGFHEMVASGLIYFTHQESPISISSDTIDRAYIDNSAESNNLRYFQKLAKTAFDPIANDKAGMFRKSKFKKYNLMNWFILVTYLNRNNIQIKDSAKLLSWFVNSEVGRVMSTEPVLRNKQGIQKLYSELQTDDGDKLVIRKNIIVKDLMQSSLLTDGTLVEVDDKRVYNASQKYELWRKQNGICPLSGKTIPLYEILDSSKWQGDHILEYSKGGKTSVDNGQLICVTAHKQKTKDFMKAS